VRAADAVLGEGPIAQSADNAASHGLRSVIARLRRASIWFRIRRQARRRGFAPRQLQRFYHYLSTSLGIERPRHVDPLQRPRNYFPGLESRAVYDTSDFPAAVAAEQDCAAIRDELFRFIAGMHLDAHPQDLTDRGRWSVLYFYAGGRPVETTARQCPTTARAIAAFAGAGQAGQAYLSVLTPDTHIEAHCGPTNTRLRAHLGLAVPDGARIRLGSEMCRWQEGGCLVFDDSFEHEVWNDSATQRAVLIIDFWHPDLTEAERWAITVARKLRWGLRDILHT
jgi:aspartyl/asparaginyl beta-hydroxylase (cupin superfamily)